jgi:N-acetyl-beta-hexosaminidase
VASFSALPSQFWHIGSEEAGDKKFKKHKNRQVREKEIMRIKRVLNVHTYVAA